MTTPAPQPKTRSTVRDKQNIASVVKNDLCHGCGVCAGTCSTKAITIQCDENRGLMLPHVAPERCTGCGTCLAICPGHGVDFASLGDGPPATPDCQAGIGPVLEYHIGHATDQAVRFTASSGGFVTALLTNALVQGKIDGVLTTRLKAGAPFRPEVFIARTVEEIREAAGSKYCPVPLGAGLSEILSGDERIAVVGLPCHIHGIRKAQSTISDLKEKIVLCVGIFCGHSDNHLATPYILEKFGINTGQVHSLAYRGMGWPGSVRVVLNDGAQHSIPYRQYIAWHERFFFSPIRCLTCVDAANRLADITVMDAWLPELELPSESGQSMILTRTPVGASFCNEGEEDFVISRRPIDEESVWRSHGQDRLRGLDFLGHRIMAKICGHIIPNYDLTFPRPTLRNYIRTFLMWTNALATRKASARPKWESFVKVSMFIYRKLAQ